MKSEQLPPIYDVTNDYPPRCVQVSRIGPLSYDIGIAIFRAEVEPPANLAFEVRRQGKFPDLLFTNNIPFKLLSDPAVQALRAAGLTGWTTFPVRLEGPGFLLAPRYSGLAITGRCGPLDNSRSRSVQRRAAVGEGSIAVYLGMYFDPASWSGDDFFVPEGRNAYSFVTERVVELFRNAGLTGASFTPLEEVERLVL